VQIMWWTSCIGNRGQVAGYYFWYLSIILVVSAVVLGGFVNEIPQLLDSGWGGTSDRFKVWAGIGIFGVFLYITGYLRFRKSISNAK